MMKVILCCLFCLVIMPITILAQPQLQPLASPIFLRDGDLWQPSDDGEIQLTSFKSVNNVVVSPDGTRVAFTVLADMSVKAIEETGGYGGGTLPNDMWILDFTTGKTTRVGGQPDNAIFPSDKTSQIIGIAHSNPSWSPDGCCLAWGEEYQHPKDYELREIVYDLSSDERRVIFNPGEQYGVPGPLSMEWGEPGLLIYEYQWDEKPINIFHVYNWIGERISTFRVEDKIVVEYGWVRDEGKSFIGMRFNDHDNWFRYDPYTSNMQKIQYPIEYYSPADPQHSLGIRRTDVGWETNGYSDENEYSFTFRYTEDFALSPDGHSIVYKSDNHSYQIYQPGLDIEIDFVPTTDVLSIFWGARDRRVRYPDKLKTIGFYECVDNDGSLFDIGDRGRVLPGDPNVLRILPGVSAGRLGLLPEGTTFTIISGPLCRNGFTWWRIEADGAIGWTAEGSGVNKWLELVGDGSS